MLVNEYPRRLKVSGSIHFTIKKEATAVMIMDDQLPRFNAV
jgi:hypothetical protein